MGVATILCTDDEGTFTIRNGLPFSRFQNWTPLDDEDDADAVTGYGTGDRHEWRFRQDYGAQFELAHIPAAYLELVGRLLRALRNGGSCTVNTGDVASRSYTCKIFPGWKTERPELTDKVAVEYTLRLKLRNTAAATMLCVYRGPAVPLS
jgi:hypothetical protein